MDFERLKEHRNHLNAFANYIGLHITQLGEGSARAEMPVTKDHLNPIGSGRQPSLSESRPGCHLSLRKGPRAETWQKNSGL